MIDIQLTDTPALTTHKQFLEAQKMMFSLIPKSRQDMLYKGLVSVLESSIRSFVSEELKKGKEEFKKDHENEVQRLIDRISELELLCDKNNIKHKVSREDVYSKRSDNFCND